jgi:PKD repeat protein
MSRPIKRLLIRPLLFLSALCSFLVSESAAQAERNDEHPFQSPQSDIDREKLRMSMLADGVAPEAVATLLLQHDRLLLEGRNPRMFTHRRSGAPGDHVCITCQGIGVEYGWSNWDGFEGFNDNLGLSFGMPASPSQPRFDITSGSGIDPLTPGNNPGDPPIPLVAPGFGSHSIRLGEPNTPGYGAERLVFPFTVGTADTSFVYTYAFVMENPSNIEPQHNDVNMPYVEFMIIDQNGDTIDCAYRRYQANETFPGQYSCNGPGQPGTIIPLYKPWTTVGVNLSAYIGQNLTVVITNADCQLGGHFAHSYWDFSCGSVPSLVPPNCRQGIPDTLTAPLSEAGNTYTYRWFRNHDPVPVGTTQSITPMTAAGDTFHVEITTSEGCRWYLFYIPQPYSIEASFTHSAVCGEITFTDRSSVPPGMEPVTGWSWTIDNGLVPGRSGRDPGVILLEPGIHHVLLEVSTRAGCRDSISVDLNIPGPPSAALVAQDVCQGAECHLNDRSTAVAGDPITVYQWMMPGGSPPSSADRSARTTYSDPGTHVVRLAVVTQSGCRDTATGQLTVFRPPVPMLQGAGESCVPFCSRYSDNSLSADGRIVSWYWTFPGGSPSTWTGEQPDEICYATPGIFNATLKVVSEKGCAATVDVPAAVVAHELPSAGFSVSPLMTSNAHPLFHFTDNSTADVVRWEWDFGDGSPIDLTGPEVEHDYSASVRQNEYYRFTPRLFVTTRYGCRDTVLREVLIEPEFSFFMPSAFTPDGNNLNAYFYGVGRGVEEYECHIFDRWGLEIWSCEKSGDNVEFDLPGKGGLPAVCQWDGYYKGNKVQQDVYVWLVKIRDVHGMKHTYTGRVTVIY